MNAINGTSGADTITISWDDTESLAKIEVNQEAAYWLDPAGFPILNVNTDGGNDTLTVDLSAGNPIPAAGITFNGGDDTDTLEIVGSTGNDTITLTGGTPAASSYEIGVANVEAFIVSLGAGDDTLNLKDGTFEFAAGDFSLGDGEDVLSITDATVTLNDNVGESASDDSDTVETHGDDANLTFNVTQYLKSLKLFDGSVVTLDGDGGDAIVTTELKINENQTLAARLDLTDNNLVVGYADSSPLEQVAAWVASGANFSEGYWNGNGITSSAAAADHPDYIRAIGFIDNRFRYLDESDPENPVWVEVPIFTEWGGMPVTMTSILVMYTYYGDADMDGDVTPNDYGLFANGFESGLKGWLNGDFDYDGAVTTNDYGLFANAFNVLHPS